MSTNNNGPVEPLVVARTQGKLGFTQPATFKELYDLLIERMPLRKVYVVVESPDGFTYREVGEFALTFIDKSSLGTVEPPVLSPLEPAAAAVQPEGPYPEVLDNYVPPSKNRTIIKARRKGKAALSPSTPAQGTNPKVVQPSPAQEPETEGPPLQPGTLSTLSEFTPSTPETEAAHSNLKGEGWGWA